MKLVFCVITKLNEHDTYGFVVKKDGDKYREVLDSDTDVKNWLHINKKVFCEGEILVLDESLGREIGGGRAPRKWFSEYEEFDNAGAAIKRSLEIRYPKES